MSLSGYWLLWLSYLRRSQCKRDTQTLLPVFLKAGNKPLIRDALPAPGGRRHSYPRWWIQGWEACINNLCYFFSLWPKPKFCSDSSLMKYPRPKSLCPVSSSWIHCFFFCLKSIKSCLLYPLPVLLSMRIPCTQIKMCFSPFKLLHVHSISPGTRSQER